MKRFLILFVFVLLLLPAFAQKKNATHENARKLQTTIRLFDSHTRGLRRNPKQSSVLCSMSA